MKSKKSLEETTSLLYLCELALSEQKTSGGNYIGKKVVLVKDYNAVKPRTTIVELVYDAYTDSVRIKTKGG